MTFVARSPESTGSGNLLLGVGTVAALAVWPLPHVPLAVAIALLFSPVWLFGLPRRGVRLLVLAWLLLPLWLIVRTMLAGVPLALDLGNSAQSNPMAWVAQAVGFAVMFGFFSWLLPQLDPARIAIVMTLVGVAWLAAATRYGETVPGWSTWKYVLAWPTGLTVVAAATVISQRHAVRSALFIVGAMGVIVVATEFRALGAMLLGAVLLVAIEHRRGGPRSARAGSGAVAVLAIVLCAVALGAAMQYGWLGDAAQQKWVEQGGTLLDVFRQGRPEPAFGVRAALDSPVVGTGVLPTFPADTVTAATQWLPPMPFEARNYLLYRITGSGMEAHSIVVNWWLATGIPGLVLTGIVVIRSAIVVCSPRARRRGLQPLQLFVALGLVWDFLFSPWTYFSGPIWGIFAALVFLPAGLRSNDGINEPGALHVTVDDRHRQPRQRVGT